MRHAIKGLNEVFKQERNFRIQILFGMAAAVLSVILPLTRMERVVVILVVGSVLVLELLNSAVERIIDTLSPRIDVLAGVVKDILAAAVFLVSVASVIIGVLIFYPHIKEIVQSF